MIRVFLIAIVLLHLSNERRLDTVRLDSPTKIVKSLRPPRHGEISPTFIQSRRFHADQFARDLRDLGQPSSFATPISSSYYLTYGGADLNLALSSQEACRLTDNICSRDYQCCSGKCRCVRWSTSGQVSCWKKCF